jgi:hypothetical protein
LYLFIVVQIDQLAKLGRFSNEMSLKASTS